MRWALILLVWIGLAAIAALLPVGLHMEWFYDEVGYAQMCVMAFGFPLYFVLYCYDNGSGVTPLWRSMLASAVLGVSLIVLGVWLFGEKERFAKLDVVAGEAVIDDVSGTRKRSIRQVEYHYTMTETGMVYRGTDAVNSGFTNTALRVGEAWPIYYLRGDPKVSRIQEPVYWDTWLLRGPIVLLGLYFLVWAPLKIWRKRPSFIG